ncbi:hypothetical protein NL676_003013 [Syzygium grande]|nr:hypothetical protein NL676_003013 [Syzygium grande]
MELVLACWNAEMRGMGSQAQASVQGRDDGVDDFHHSAAVSEHLGNRQREKKRSIRPRPPAPSFLPETSVRRNAVGPTSRGEKHEKDEREIPARGPDRATCIFRRRGVRRGALRIPGNDTSPPPALHHHHHHHHLFPPQREIPARRPVPDRSFRRLGLPASLDGDGRRGREGGIGSRRREQAECGVHVRLPPGASPEKSPMLSPTPVRDPAGGDSWKDVFGGGCGFAMAVSDSGKLITWGSADDEAQSYMASGKHGDTPEPFPLPTQALVLKAAAGWAHCVTVTGENMMRIACY